MMKLKEALEDRAGDLNVIEDEERMRSWAMAVWAACRLLPGLSGNVGPSGFTAVGIRYRYGCPSRRSRTAIRRKCAG